MFPLYRAAKKDSKQRTYTRDFRVDYRTSLTPGQREALCPLRSQVHEQSFTSLIAESGVLQFCWRQSCDVDGQASLTLVLVRSNACHRGRGSRERATPWIKASRMFREAVRAASAYVRAQKRESGIPRGKRLAVRFRCSMGVVERTEQTGRKIRMQFGT